jgi:hypothetical protein
MQLWRTPLTLNGAHDLFLLFLIQIISNPHLLQ